MSDEILSAEEPEQGQPASGNDPVAEAAQIGSDPGVAPARIAARGSSRSPIVIAALVVMVVVLLGATTWVAWPMLSGVISPPTRRGMAETALKGIEAVIAGDAGKLASLSDATMKSQITPEFTATLKASGLDSSFSDPKWNGDSFEVVVATGMGDAVVLGGPVPDGKPVVLFRTMGGIGATTGGVTLTPSGSGWLITQFVVGKSAPATGSVSATGSVPTSRTPSATSTP